MKSNWNEVLISEYFSIMRTLENDKLSNEVKELHIVSILSNITVKELKKINNIEYRKMLSNISFLETPLVESKVPNNIIIKGKQFKVTNKISDITAGDYIDFVILSENWKDNMIDILTIFIKPAKKEKGFFNTKYIEIPYNRQELKQFFTENLTIDIANSLMVFFYKVYMNSISRTKLFLELEKLKMKRILMKKSTPIEMKKALKDGLVALEEYLKRL